MKIQNIKVLNEDEIKECKSRTNSFESELGDVIQLERDYSNDIAYKNIINELQIRSDYLQKMFIEINEYLSSKSDDWFKLHNNYIKFNDLVYDILTSGNNITLHSGKDKICTGKIESTTYYGEEQERECDFYVNSNFFGKHRVGESTMNHLNMLRYRELMMFIGRYSDKISEVLSNYNKKSEKIERIGDLIRNYGYDENPPSYLTKVSINDGINNILVQSYKVKEVSPDGRTTSYEDEKRYHEKSVKELSFMIKDSKTKNSQNTKNSISFRCNFDNLRVYGDTHTINIHPLIERKNLLYMIDNVDNIQNLANECIRKRDEKINKFKCFLEDMKEEFSSEIIAMRL